MRIGGVFKANQLIGKYLVGDAFFSEHLPRIDRDQVRLSMHLKGK